VLATHIQHLLCFFRWSCHAAPHRSLACVVYTNKKAKEKNTCFTVPYSITYESTKLETLIYRISEEKLAVPSAGLVRIPLPMSRLLWVILVLAPENA
jgi:hypothetical protein